MLEDGEALIESTAILDFLDELVGSERAMLRLLQAFTFFGSISIALLALAIDRSSSLLAMYAAPALGRRTKE